MSIEYEKIESLSDVIRKLESQIEILHSQVESERREYAKLKINYQELLVLHQQQEAKAREKTKRRSAIQTSEGILVSVSTK